MSGNHTLGRQTASEDLVAEKWDKAATQFITKTGAGIAGGIFLSVLLFRRRVWPVTLGAGFGIGAAYADCQRLFDPDRNLGKKQ
ncbi:hypothetical protein BJ684DRAFT_20462 [Piptocephalis cylindrospora]|uniref:MICOS complex subunit MIC10 n=1 Tax=Piptocephalis cylindrospora TaxID=1907219 RepID=A0A4P9Y2H1_9FUNG|nr:hypothetical protein BJ684DRAFT_20462 [Piptocephalis cylindrospora]|eukprot:RKP13025.1 hypothetical protein BJ684DRAFT_20462 [Piptocephalis cylindrospora]